MIEILYLTFSFVMICLFMVSAYEYGNPWKRGEAFANIALVALHAAFVFGVLAILQKLTDFHVTFSITF